MARLFIITINYAPEPSGFAPHVTAFAEHLAHHGHRVSVFTGFPFAPEWRRRPEDRGRVFARQRNGNLTVYRLTHFIPRRPSSALQRMLMEGSFSAVGFAALVAALLKSGRPDALIYVGAQPALAMLSRIVAALVDRPYLVRITDLAARAAVDVGIVGHRLSRVLDAFEFAAYTKAAGAAVLCRSFEQALGHYGYPPDRIRVIANPIDIEQVRPVSRSGRFRARYQIPESAFVVMHAGSMGLKQGLRNVIAAAALTRESAVHWVFVGDGEVRADVVAAARERGLQDKVHFVPFQPDDALSETFADADLLLGESGARRQRHPHSREAADVHGRRSARAGRGEPRKSGGGAHARGWRRHSDRTRGSRGIGGRGVPLSASDAGMLDAFGARNRAYAVEHFDQQKVLAEQEAFLLERIT